MTAREDVVERVALAWLAEVNRGNSVKDGARAALAALRPADVAALLPSEHAAATAARDAEVRRLREENKRLRETLSLCDGHGKRAEVIFAPEDREVEALCERIGYGATMDAAARLWFRKDPKGAFTVGPCALTVRAALTEARGDG